MLLDILIGFVSQFLNHQVLRGPIVREHIMKYKWTKLDGSINQPKLERIQSLALTFTDWHAFHLLCNNIYLLNYVFKLSSLWQVNDLHLLVIQDTFRIFLFIYFCHLVKLNLFNQLLPLSNYYNLYIAFFLFHV